jgi:aryl-alcohol dehydrogenase-like predicted oxidoreductase
MGVAAWSPLAKGLLTGKYRKGQQQPDSLRAKYFPKMMSDERSLAVVEQLIAVAQSAGLSLTHMALSFVITHPAVTSAIMEQLDDLLACAEATLSDELLDQIDRIVPPGVDVAPLEGSAYTPPAISQISLRRRPVAERSLSAHV